MARPARAILRQDGGTRWRQRRRGHGHTDPRGGKTLVRGVADVRRVRSIFWLLYAARGRRPSSAMADRAPGPAGETNHLRTGGGGERQRASLPVIARGTSRHGEFSTGSARGRAGGGHNNGCGKPASSRRLWVACEARFKKKIFFKARPSREVAPARTRRWQGWRDDDQPPRLLVGVAFTGSTEVARIINRTLAQRDGRSCR